MSQHRYLLLLAPLGWLAFALAMPIAWPAVAHAQVKHRIVQLLDAVGYQPTIGAQVPLDLEFVDHQGRPTKLRDCLQDKPVVLHVVYFGCPMLCNLATDGLLRSLETLSLNAGDDFSIVTVSFDPREGPEFARTARETMLARYRRSTAEQGWHVLTGTQASIDRLTQAINFRYALDSQSGQFAHAAGLVVLDAQGKIARFIGGIDFPARDLRLALVEGSQGTVGTRSDQVMLLCYQYDPTTGKYGLAIMRLVQVAGTTTALALALAVGLLLRREHRQEQALVLSSAPLEPTP